MKIESVKFIQRDDKQAGLIMPGGFWVFKSTMKTAWTSVHGNWANIDWSAKQTAKSMIGIERWGDAEDRGFNQALGRSVRYFVRHDMLPERLELARKSNGKYYKGGSTKYVLAGTQIVAVASVAADLNFSQARAQAFT